MGIDVEITCMGDPSDEEIARANEFLEARYWPLSWGHADFGEDQIVGRRYGHVRFDCGGARYYGPGYERGDWGAISSALHLALGAFPDYEIRYGGDSTGPENHSVVTASFIEEMWSYYLFHPDGLAYRQR